MIVSEEYEALVPRLQTLLDDLDRLQLPMVAVLIDHALCRVKEVIAKADAVTVEQTHNDNEHQAL